MSHISPGRIVWYTSRTGNYFLPAMVIVTRANLHRPGVEAGHVPDITADDRCHLWVFSPGPAGLRAAATDFKSESPHGRQENLGGGYNEFDIGYDPDGAPGTWRWPDRS
jgi:hypothetical protein